MNRFSVKAIVLGALAMFSLDLLTGIVSIMVFGGGGLRAGASQDEIKAVAELARQSDGYLFTTLVFGTLTTVFGGYVAARVTTQLPLLNACALGVVALGTGILLSGQNEGPMWLDIVGTISTVPAAIVGGYLGRRARKR